LSTNSTLFILGEVQVQAQMHVIVEWKKEGEEQEEDEEERGSMHGSKLNDHAM
jgi:hypothetical protein